MTHHAVRPPPLAWHVRDRTLTLNRPFVVGILNVTPDSFSDGGRFVRLEAARAHAEQMLSEGADAIDVGGESTRPQGATPVDAEEESRRVIPVVRALRAGHAGCVISVDTSKSEVAARAIAEGADVINDVSAFRLDRRLGAVCAKAGVGVILMHSRGGVSDMATAAHAAYGEDVVGEVLEELRRAVAAARAQGVEERSIALDPGIGFAKRMEHSLAVLAGLSRLVALGFPVMVGVSRKRFIGELSGVADPAERTDGTTAANVMALAAGARIFRVHDVRAARRALDVAWAIVERQAEA